MNIWSFSIGAFAVFAFFFAWGWFFHGYLLNDLYEQTSSLWRTPKEMNKYFPASILFQLALSFILSLIFSVYVQNPTIQTGLQIGVFVGLLIGVVQAGMFPYSPIPWTLALAWFFGAFVQFTVAGLILSAAYIYLKF